MLTKNLLLFLTILLLFSACSPRYDIPQHYFITNETNALKLRQKNDLIVSGSGNVYTFTHDVYNPLTFDFDNFQVNRSSGNIQVGYSPLKYLGVFGSHTQLRNRDSRETSNVFHKSHLSTIGVGSYYGTKFLQRPLDKILPGRKEKNDKIVVDLYGGYSIGQFQNTYFSVVGDNKFNFHKLFYQFGIHWEFGALGVSYIHKRGIATFPSGTINGEATFNQSFPIQNILEDNQINFSETAFQVDFKKEKVGIYGQLITANVRELGYSATPDYIINIGVTVDIHSFAKTAIFKEKN